MYSSQRSFAFLVLFAFTGNLLIDSSSAIGQEESMPSLQLSEGISDRVYSRSTTTLTTEATGSLAVDSSLRIFFPKEFSLSNNYFTVPYSKSSKALPGIMLGPRAAFAEFTGVKLNGILHVGYAYTQGIINVESESGLQVNDAVELQWIPIQGGLEAISRPLTAQRIQLGILSTAGMDWYTQSGQLDGMNQSFWVPRYEIGSSVTLFSHAGQESGGFDGIRMSGVYYRSFASKQINLGWAADIGAQYAF